MLFQGIVKQALGVLKALAGNDDIKIAIVKAEGVQLILAAMTQHQGTQNLRVVMDMHKAYNDNYIANTLHFNWTSEQ